MATGRRAGIVVELEGPFGGWKFLVDRYTKLELVQGPTTDQKH